jgi:rRNA maturation endonuclease Nob1
MYNLDNQFAFNNEENLFKLGTWLRRKTHACEVKLKEAEETLGECGFAEDVLRREWEAQVKAQTKPLPRKSLISSYLTSRIIDACGSYRQGQTKNQGKSAVEEAIRLRKSRDAAQAHVDELRSRIIDVSSEHWEIATAELELDAALTVLTKARAKVTKKESAMGVTARQQLHHLLKSPFLAKKMNARALKTRVRERLRGRKFELDRLERSYRKQRSGTFTIIETVYFVMKGTFCRRTH